jgi:hypothetical protein
MLEHPYIDFDGDGHGDSYDTVASHDGSQEFDHHDKYGHVDAAAFDYNRDGLIDQMVTDSDHNGALDTQYNDRNGDGIMDDSVSIGNNHPDHTHPYIDFNGDGHGDRYYSTSDQYGASYTHVDGHGHIDAKAWDRDHDGLIDEMAVDRDHDGYLDTFLQDTTGDGIMDTARRI